MALFAPLVKLSGGFLERLTGGVLARLELLWLGLHKDPAVLRCIRSIHRDNRGWPLASEGFLLHSLARAQTKVPGDYAEVGVFRGSSARLICEGKGDRRLHLFDTFTGLPEGSPVDRGVFRPHQYACDRQSVEEYLASFPGVFFHEGLFPESTRGVANVENARYALAHFDVDLYESTRACLEFFYPRMTPGGVIVSHDYSFIPAVRQAFDEFMTDKPEGIIELPTSQCIVLKR